MLFYAIFTLALLLRMNVYKFVGAVLGIMAIGSFFSKPTWPVASFYLNTGVLEFFYGMLIAKFCLANKHVPKILALPLMIIGFVGLLVPIPYLAFTNGLPHGIAAACIIASMAALEDYLTRIPRFVLYMADASYVIYLFHPLIAPAVPTVLIRLHLVYPWLSVAGSISLALAVGCLIHLLVEDPITRWFRDHLLIRGKKVIHTVTTT
jgi:peptidoglycan/LPS O-acetylase OafA/YrhL